MSVGFRARLAKFSSSNDGHTSAEFLESLHNSQLGATGVIICNGPSLNSTDLSLIGDLPFIMMNRGYLLGNRVPGKPTAVCVSARPVLEQYSGEIESLDAPLFVPYEDRDLLSRRDRLAFIGPEFKWKFATRLGRSMHRGGTVTFSALQLAYHLGWAKTIIVGLDHSYNMTGDPSKLVTTVGADANHFDPNYFQHGAVWLLPDLERNDYSYKLAKYAFESDGREVVDCTVDGQCFIFRKSTLESEILAAD